MATAFDLSVILPMRNEAAVVRPVIEGWVGQLDRLHIVYELRVYDDQSTDGTGSIADELSRKWPHVVVTHHPRVMGHGPTVLRGYREARGEWVFQVDGDGEIGPGPFPDFWSRRHSCDFVLGWRVERHSPPVRRFLTVAARISLRLLFGGSVRDANIGYRLMRRSILFPFISRLPDDTFAPNLVLTGLALRRRVRLGEEGVHYEAKGGAFSWRSQCRLALAAPKAFFQLIASAFRPGSRRR